MIYSEKQFFDFMDSGRQVLVTCDDGQKFKGRCWAYGAIYNEEEFGILEPSLQIGSTILYAGEIEKIEFVEESEDK